MNETQRVLSDALELMRTKGWTKDYFARDARGRDVSEQSSDAVCFCAWGSLSACTKTQTYKGPAYRALSIAAGFDGTYGVVSANDSLSTFAEVEAWFARAIELAGKDGE